VMTTKGKRVAEVLDEIGDHGKDAEMATGSHLRHLFELGFLAKPARGEYAIVPRRRQR
jgi:hypothetical protein